MSKNQKNLKHNEVLGDIMKYWEMKLEFYHI